MIDVSNFPIGDTRWSRQVRMGDPQDAPGQDPRLKVLVYPYPTAEGAPDTFACWPTGGNGWQAVAEITDSCLFQVSSTGTALHAERGGPLDWLVIPGLF